MKRTADALGLSRQNFYISFVQPGIVKETGWLGNARFWDSDGLAAAGVAIAEYRAVKAEQRAARRDAQLAKAAQLAEKYKSGMTLEEIGATESVTRERVRQLLAMVDISGKDGGAHKHAISRSAAIESQKVSRREIRCQKVYGCAFREFVAVANSNSLVRNKSNRLLSLYWHHRTTAQRAAIEWGFSLPQYAELIGDRAHLFKRARDGLVLSRIDKHGPFTPENCTVATLAQNSAWTGGLGKAREQRIKTAVNIKALYDSGMTLPAIAKKMACSRAQVMSLLAYARNNGA